MRGPMRVQSLAAPHAAATAATAVAGAPPHTPLCSNNAGKKAAAAAAPPPPFKPAKFGHYERQVGAQRWGWVFAPVLASKSAASPARSLPRLPHQVAPLQIVDYVRTATAKNVWYYRSAGVGAKPSQLQQPLRSSCSEPLTPVPPKRSLGLPTAPDCHHPGPSCCCCSDRMSVPRGPCSLPVLREAWVDGVIDENTLVCVGAEPWGFRAAAAARPLWPCIGAPAAGHSPAAAAGRGPAACSPVACALDACSPLHHAATGLGPGPGRLAARQERAHAGATDPHGGG